MNESLEVKLSTVWKDEKQRREESEKRREEERREEKRREEKSKRREEKRREEKRREKRREEKRREEKREEHRRSEKRKSQRKEDAGAQKGSEVAKDCVFRWFVALEGRQVCSLKRWVRNRLARRNGKLHAALAGSTCPSQYVQCTKHHLFGSFLDVPMSLCVAVARDSAPCQSEQNVRVLSHVRKRCRRGANMILCYRCSMSYDLALLFSWHT